MADVLNIALTGLLAYQQSLATTSHNVTNANTPGFSRQTADIQALPGSFSGGFFLGSGSVVQSVSRAFDAFANIELMRANSNAYDVSSYLSYAKQLDGLVSDPNAGVSSGLQDFFSALQVAANSPSSSSERATFLSQAQLLVNRFHELSNQIDATYDLLNQDMKSTVEEINKLAQGIAEINRSVIGSVVKSADMLDKRDQLVNQLSQLVSVNTVEQGDGAINVFIGSGQPLIVSGNTSVFAVIPNASDVSSFDISLQTNANLSIPVTGSIEGGKLGGILRFRSEVLGTARNELGRVAIGLAQTFNQQHQLGMDLGSKLGGNFFKDMNGATTVVNRVLNNSGNTGTASFGVNIVTPSALTTSDYQLFVAPGPAIQLTRLSDNKVTAIASFPVTIDGFTINLNAGAVAVGDSFIVSPTREGSRDIAIQVTDPSQIALASPIRTSASTANVGDGKISAGDVVNTQTTAFTTTPGQLAPPLQIVFLSATTYRIQNATTSAVIEGPISFTPNQDNIVFPTPGAFDPGFRVSLSGSPVAGDTFSISYNAGGFGDNRNAFKLSALQTAKTLGGGTANYQDAYAGFVANVGLRTHEADVSNDVNGALLRQAETRKESISGVNLDEEAANMLRFQQNYQAAAQLVQVARSLFDTLISTFH